MKALFEAWITISIRYTNHVAANIFLLTRYSKQKAILPLYICTFHCLIKSKKKR